VFSRILCDGLALTRTDAAIDFDWSKTGPATGVGHGWYSVRWDGWLKAPKPGKYLLELDATIQGTRVFLDGRVLIDLWPLEGPTAFAVEVELTGRPQQLRVEMNQQNAHPKPRLLWSQVGGFAKRVVATDYLFTDEKLARETPVPAVK
jgi:hypothetical protein